MKVQITFNSPEQCLQAMAGETYSAKIKALKLLKKRSKQDFDIPKHHPNVTRVIDCIKKAAGSDVDEVLIEKCLNKNTGMLKSKAPSGLKTLFNTLKFHADPCYDRGDMIGCFIGANSDTRETEEYKLAKKLFESELSLPMLRLF